MAQFARFEEFSQWIDRRIVPQPQHLYGLNAQARYVQWMKEQEDDRLREEHQESQKRIRNPFSLEERNLRSMMRALQMQESDVLVEQFSQFSEAFLKHKGVWRVVKKQYNEERAS